MKKRAVEIEYTLTDDGGPILDRSLASEPLDYIQGAGISIPGLDLIAGWPDEKGAS